MLTAKRGNDRAGFFEAAELERDRSADHRLLPFVRDVEVADPVEPVVPGLIVELAGKARDYVGQRLVGMAAHD